MRDFVIFLNSLPVPIQEGLGYAVKYFSFVLAGMLFLNFLLKDDGAESVVTKATNFIISRWRKERSST